LNRPLFLRLAVVVEHPPLRRTQLGPAGQGQVWLLKRSFPLLRHHFSWTLRFARNGGSLRIEGVISYENSAVERGGEPWSQDEVVRGWAIRSLSQSLVRKWSAGSEMW